MKDGCMEKNKFYVTTPIYYVTAKPHLGSLYSTLLADVIARWNKIQQKKVFFLTGTDEHGQKIAQAAQAAGKDPQLFVDNFIPDYKKAWNLYNIQYDTFARTSSDSHIQGAQQLVQKLIDNGHVYKSEYSGMYCTPCETFVVGEAKTCPSCGRETAWLSEETYFFKLSSFADQLLDFYRNNPDFITPKERSHEIISFVESGLHDLSISRTSVPWGVPFPGDTKHTIYVWVEALCIYITAIGYGQKNKSDDFNYWWPANVHVVGKDIIRFHAVYWPAILMAADMPLPKKLLVHGWIKVDKQKMSKSLGNVVDPLALQDTYGTDSIRYYLMRQIPVNQDGDFSIVDVETRIESDLANDLGNLLNRMIILGHKYGVLTIESCVTWSPSALELRDECSNTIIDFSQQMNEYMFHHALARMWHFIHKVNAYFHGKEPWKLAQSDKIAFLEVIAATSHSLYTIALLLWPIMPQKMEELLAALGFAFDTINCVESIELNTWNKTFILHKVAPLFEKPIQNKEENTMQPIQEIQKEESYITIDDVAKVDIRVGTIQACEVVEGSDKLVKMIVNLGEVGMRTILAGIRKSHEPAELVQKRGIFIVNLKPRKMAGHESQGMMLVAQDQNGDAQLLQAPVGVANGIQLR
jgi:methionyl-tRNA synthetase